MVRIVSPLVLGLALGACATKPSTSVAPATAAAAPVPGQDEIVLEAEQGRGDWTIKQDAAASGGRYINDPGAGAMTYTITLPKPGRWYLFLRAQRGADTPATDDENDVFVRVQGEKLWAMDEQTRPDGMRVHGTSWQWTFLPKGPGSHTPPPIKRGNVHMVIPQAGTYTLELRHRSKNLSIDKILLKHESLPHARALPDTTEAVAATR